MARRQIKNVLVEAEQFQRRAFIGFLFVLTTFVALSLGYLWLQVFRHDEYRTMAEENRIKPRPVVPARGLIYDRNGKLLADNIPAYRLEITPDQAGDVDKAVRELKKIITLSDEDIEAFHKSRKSQRSFFPSTLKLKLNEEEVARFALERYRFPGVEVTPYLTRRYLYGDLLAHVIGYVGRVDEKDLSKWEGTPLTALTHIGKTGIERYYEERLHGTVGYAEEEVNVQGRRLRTVKQNPATAGEDLMLSIDADLQRATVEAFAGMDGSAVAVDTRTGEVLAMVSLPTFDSNLFVNGISHKDYRALTENLSRPMYDRNLNGGGPPGSTIKPFVGLAGLESGLRRPEDKILSTGEFRIPGVARGFRDSHTGGHGWVDLRQSIAQSVNTYYYKLALDMGIERFDQYLSKYGFGRVTGIDLHGENAGVLPSPEWKRKRFKQDWYPGETVNSGIGQGYWIVTPLQLAQGTASIANGGVRRSLRLVHAQRNGFNEPWKLTATPAGERIVADSEHLRAVQEGMLATINSPRGTAVSMGRGAPYLIAGKTGTAQKISRKGSASFDPHKLPLHLRHRALFVGYAPADNPSIAVAVVVEYGGYGGSTAAPIARRIFDAWLMPKEKAEDATLPATNTQTQGQSTVQAPTNSTPQQQEQH